MIYSTYTDILYWPINAIVMIIIYYQICLHGKCVVKRDDKGKYKHNVFKFVCWGLTSLLNI